MSYFHVMNRGVDKRSIALDTKDKLRFVWSLYEMNNAHPVENTARSGSTFDTVHQIDDRKRLVTIHAWCLMGNHYHLLLSDEVSGGMSAFLRKLNIGYTHYFNLRHDRSGVLFQGKTKRVQITTDAHFLYILPYIHLNPLDFSKQTSGWRTQCIRNSSIALRAITEYRWSSYRNYTGELEFAPILSGSELYAERGTHTTELREYLRAVPDTGLQKLSLE
jgi:putative transposase